MRQIADQGKLQRPLLMLIVVRIEADSFAHVLYWELHGSVPPIRLPTQWPNMIVIEEEKKFPATIISFPKIKRFR